MDAYDCYFEAGRSRAAWSVIVGARVAAIRHPRTSEADAVDRLSVAEPAHAKLED